MPQAGIVGALQNRLRRLLGKPAYQAVTPTHPFDATYGVDTSGLLDGSELRAGHGNDPHNTAYFGVPPSRFVRAIELWQSTPGTGPIEQYRFIDIGCGKGRAILLASRMPFQDVFGIDLNPSLIQTAQANLQRWQEQVSTVATISIFCGDGPSLVPSLLTGRSLIYLYNPFRAPVLRSLLKAILSTAAGRAGPVDVLYLYPEFEDVFRDFPMFQQVWHKEVTLSPEDENDGFSSFSDPCSLYRLLPASNRG